jgi:hypothetical protein
LSELDRDEVPDADQLRSKRTAGSCVELSHDDPSQLGASRTRAQRVLERAEDVGCGTRVGEGVVRVDHREEAATAESHRRAEDALVAGNC